MSELQQQVTQTLAVAFNLLSEADLGLKGKELQDAAAAVRGFQAVIQSLSDGKLEVIEVVEAEDDDEVS